MKNHLQDLIAAVERLEEKAEKGLYNEAHAVLAEMNSIWERLSGSAHKAVQKIQGDTPSE